jgi:arabinogalactan endo-1,4-beta-galactosidase
MKSLLGFRINSSVLAGLFCVVFSVVSPAFIGAESPSSYMIGADISWVQQQEGKGTKFSDNGVSKDVLQILKDNSFNWIRLRLFVDPSTEKGYSQEGYCDLQHTLAMAKRIKAAGLKFLLDFHYSDNWADPGKQIVPESWAALSGPALEDKIFSYTKEVINRFKKEGVTPDMVQIGNEINHGMMWPYGAVDSTYVPLCGLLRNAGKGVRAADSKIKIMVHIACGGQNEESVYFFDRILQNKVPFDLIGESYYPKWHGTLDDLKNNLTDLIHRYHKPIVVVEYQDFREEVNEIVKNLPQKLGLGTFIWEATSPRWGALFDSTGFTTEYMKIYPKFRATIR